MASRTEQRDANRNPKRNPPGDSGEGALRDESLDSGSEHISFYESYS
jgi:hypothetical protein